MIHREDRDGIAVLRIEHGKANAIDTEFFDSLAPYDDKWVSADAHAYMDFTRKGLGLGAFTAALYAADRWGPRVKVMEEMTFGSAMAIGVAQAVANSRKPETAGFMDGRTSWDPGGSFGYGRARRMGPTFEATLWGFVSGGALVLGAASGSRVAVDEGLAGGEEVVLDPPASLRDGDRVRRAGSS